MKRNTIIVIILILFISAFVLGESSINPLTRGLADELYCYIDGTNCALGGGGGNGTYDLNVTGNSGTGVILDNEVLDIVGEGNITTIFSGNQLQISYNGSVSSSVDNDSLEGSFLMLNNTNQASWTPTTTKVTNLNADLLDGYTTGIVGSVIPLLDGANQWDNIQQFNAGYPIQFITSGARIWADTSGHLTIFASKSLSFNGSPANFTNDVKVKNLTIEGLASCSTGMETDSTGSVFCGNVGGSPADVWVNESGDTWTGNMDAGGNNLEDLDFLHTDQLAIGDELPPKQVSNIMTWARDSHPTTVYEAIRPNDGGLALNLFQIDGNNTADNTYDTIGVLGFYGDMGSGGGAVNPLGYYWFMGTKNTTAWNADQAFKVSDESVAINKSGTDLPSYTLEVQGTAYASEKVISDRYEDETGGSYIILNSTGVFLCGSC